MTAVELMEGYSAYTTAEELSTTEAAQSGARSITASIVTTPTMTISVVTTAFNEA